MSEGLAFWTKLAGNVGLFTTSSSAVPASVYDGTYGIGLAIDYYAWDYIALSEAIGFTYGGASTFSPDPVAILLGATNMPQAEKFMDYIMSTDGQSKVGKYRIPANKEAVPESLRIPRAWDDTGNINPDFPLIDPFNVSLDGAIHTETRKFFDNYYIKNSDKLSQAWDAIGKATDATARDNAIALLTKLPSNFDGTFAGFDAIAETDPSVQGNWTSEGATNFDAAKAEAPKDYGNPINPTTTTTGTGTQPTTTDEGTTQVPGFEALLLLGGFGVLVIFRRKRR